jgi:hypothetical protein
MIYLAIDHFDAVTNKAMPNGIPINLHDQIESMDGSRLDYPRLIQYLTQCNIQCRPVLTELAPKGSWYPLVLGWFNFNEDYLSLLSKTAYKRLKKKELKLVFTYHEGDHPGKIRRRLDDLCALHNIDGSLVWFISGNSSADQYYNTVYWPELEFMYWRTVDLTNNYAIFHRDWRFKSYTALCRIDKLWRKVFMSDLWANGLDKKGYFSYNQHLLGQDDNYYLCALDNDYLANCQNRVDKFISAGPFKIDNLSTTDHNKYDVNMTGIYADSYFNVVLETMLDLNNSGGQFVTEKTFKPIFNNQFFVVVSAAGHLQHLKDLGYKTFSRLIDENYDSITNHQQRFEAVLYLTKYLANQPLEKLHNMYINLEPEITHNHAVFKAGMAHRLQSIVDCINCKQ